MNYNIGETLCLANFLERLKKYFTGGGEAVDKAIVALAYKVKVSI